MTLVTMEYRSTTSPSLGVRHLLTSRLAALWYAVLLVGLVGCANEGPCEPGYCACTDTDDCSFVCNDVPCVGECQSLSSCDGTCRDGCDLSCNSTSDCDLACGDDCTVECRSVSTCDVDCGAGCAVDCVDLASCSVLMDSGVVRCERASTCDIRCATPAGSEPAVDCGDGRWVCAPSTC